MADWASETAALIERTVANVRERTVDPAHRATRIVVYGLLGSFFVLTALVVVVILAFRARATTPGWPG